MDSYLLDPLALESRKLLEEEARIEREMRSVEERLSGLRDLDLALSLAATKLDLCLLLMKRIVAGNDAATRQTLGVQVAEKALAALRLVEGLLAENVSEDQKGIVRAHPLYAGVKAHMEQFLLAGGGGFLEARQADSRRRRILSRSIVAALRKYTGEDDRYPPLELERFPRFVRKALLFLFPVLMREHPEQPPYGIEEGDEVTYSSRNMKMPLSQAIFYMENELLPELERKLAERPGSGSLQEEIARVRGRVEDYRKLRFFPRSTPVLLEQGFHTDGMTGYTVDGEMLVPIPLPVSFRSGTNLERKMELVRMDVVRRIAGRKVSREIDKEYRRLRSLESGIRGSSRTASMKLDAAWGYRVLRQEFPFVARLADKGRFQELSDIAQSGTPGALEQRIEALIESDQKAADLLSPSLEMDPPEPPGGTITGPTL